MLNSWLVATGVIVILLVERIVVTRVTRSPRGREWVRHTPLLHPNGISLLRMPMGLVGVWMAHQGWWEASTLFFGFWMISDITDGTIARACELETESGKWLDPLSDKFMYFPALVYCAVAGNVRVPLPWGWVTTFLLIDALGQASRLVIRKQAANYFGKAKTAFVTIVLACTALDQMQPLWFMSDRFVYAVTVSATLLAFLSVYCRVIPDSWYANSLTLANFLCGTAAIWNVFVGHPLRAFVLVFLGQFFDLFDGRMARLYGSTRHGPIFDDIADGTSFGLAIGYLIVQELQPGIPPLLAGVVGGGYVVCVIYRLYRFLRPTTPLAPGIFQGMPSPAGAMLAGSAVLLFGEHAPWLALALAVTSALLMISNLHYRHFARRIWPVLPRVAKLLVCILFVIFVDVALAHRNFSLFFSLFCFLLGVTYAVYGLDPDTYLPSRRKRAAAADAAPPQAPVSP
jgi:CDP-diacylglycerol---serine O-phosphatidyltransferase